MAKTRLDTLIVERGIAPSRERARSLIMAGQVLVGGRRVDKPGTGVDPAAKVALAGEGQRFVSRGGLKLEHALEHFGIDVRTLVVADVGASTGGFTDCLLQRGAARVYAIDVGQGQLDWKLRQDPRVVVMERTNARLLRPLPEPVDAAVVDVSFISLRLVLPVVRRLLREHGWVVALIKPQFEAGPRLVGKGGVVRDPAVHGRVVDEVLRAAEALGFQHAGLCPSPLLGPAGNREFLVHLRTEGRISNVLGERMGGCLPCDVRRSTSQ